MSTEAIVTNGELNGGTGPSPAPQSLPPRQPTLEEAAAAQMAQLDLEGNKMPTPVSSKTKSNGSARNGVREASPASKVNSSTTVSARPTTRSSSSNNGNSRTSSTTRSASSSRKSSQHSMSSTPQSTTPEIKKVPMNKIVVGTSPSPNVAKVSSKIGSLQNSSYKPTGGNVKIENKKLTWKAESKIGSMDNVKHRPGGGNIKIENQKIELKVQSKVGSLQNVKHRPGGGEKKIFDDKEYLRQQKQMSGGSNSSKPGSSKGGSKGSSIKGSVENLIE